jgi:hypothetical protein
LILYDQNDLWQEIVYLGYHVNWGLEELLTLEHDDRIRVIREVARLISIATEGGR